VRGLAGLLLLVPLAAACGGTKKAAEPATTAVTTTTAPAAATPAGFVVHAVKSQRFSIAVPKAWRAIDASTALTGSAIEQFQRENPAVASAVQALAQPDSPMKLLAVDPVPRAGFATNVNVLVTTIPASMSFATWTRMETQQLAALKPKRLTRKVEELPAGKAYRVAYHAFVSLRGARRELALRQYMVKRGGSLYVVTYTTNATEEAGRAATFEQSARTLSLGR